MTTEADIGWGAEFHLDNALGVLTEIGEILGVPLPNEQVDDVEATHMKSPNRTREYIAGLIDAGEGTFEMNYVAGSASDALLRAAKSDGVTRSYKVVIPVSDGTTWEVSGDCYVKGYERNVPIDDRQTANVTVRFSGSATEAAGV